MNNDDNRIAELLREWETRRCRGESPMLVELTEGDTALALKLQNSIDELEEHSPIHIPFREDAVAVTVSLPAGEFSTVDGESLPKLPFHPISPIDGYEILHEIARGGMGVIYKARHRTLDRVVALKRILAGQLAGSQEIERFYQEARAAAKLRHPNIVAIHEIGEIDSQPFFTMDFIEGKSLAEKLRERPLGGREAAELLAAVAEAVHYAHEKGVVHRDLKPANVLIDQQNRPHVTDFGLAKRQDGDSGLTVTGQVLGTPSYMPPEQAAGDCTVIGPTSDVYSLGATLYAMLTGRPPFTSPKIADVLLQVMTQDPVSPRRLAPAVDFDLETICLKCLEKGPAKRYPSAAELAADLRRYLRNEPITARPLSSPTKAWRWCRRNPVIAGLSAAVLLILCTGITVSSTLAVIAQERASQLGLANQQLGHANANLTSKQRALEAEQQKVRDANIDLAKALEDVTTQKDSAEKELRKFELMHYHDHIGRANAALNAHDFVTAEQELNLCVEKHRHVEYAYVRRQWEERAPLSLDGESSSVLVVSADGRRLISGGSDHTIKVWDLESGKVTHTFRGHSAGVACLAISPDGRRLYSGGIDRAIKIWDLETMEEIGTLAGHTNYVVRLVLSRDGRQLYSGSRDRTIKIWDLEAGKEMHTLRGHSDSVFCLNLSSDGRQLYSGSMDGTIRVWDLETKQDTHTLRGHTQSVHSLALSPDGRRLYSASMDQTIKVWDLQTGKVSVTLLGHTSFVEDLATSLDGRWLYSASMDRTIKVWDLETARETLSLTGHLDGVLSLALSPDGRRIYSGSADKTIKVWDLEARRGTLTLHGPAHYFVNSLTLSVDGRRLYSGHSDRTIRVWNLETGHETPPLSGHEGSVESLALSGDGRLLYSASGDQTVKTWDLLTGNEQNSLSGHTKGVRCLSLCSDGRRLYSGSEDGKIKTWDLKTGKATQTLPGHPNFVLSLVLSPDGRRLYSTSSSDRTIKAWDLETEKEIRTFHGHTNYAVSLAISPDGRKLYSGSKDQTIKVWDLETGQERLTLRGHSGGVNYVMISADGRRLYSASADKTIKLWDLETGTETLTLRGHTESVDCLALSLDSRRLCSGSLDGIKVWELSVPEQSRLWQPSAADILADTSPDDVSHWQKVPSGWQGKSIGTIVKQPDGGTAHSATARKLPLLQKFAGDYQLDVDFSREPEKGDWDVNVILPVGDRQVMLLTKTREIGFDEIEGQRISKPWELPAGRQHRLTIQVRLLNDDECQVSVAISGQHAMEYRGPRQNLKLRDLWKFDAPQQAALGVFGATATFHHVWYSPLPTLKPLAAAKESAEAEGRHVMDQEVSLGKRS